MFGIEACWWNLCLNLQHIKLMSLKMTLTFLFSSYLQGVQKMVCLFFWIFLCFLYTFLKSIMVTISVLSTRVLIIIIKYTVILICSCSNNSYEYLMNIIFMKVICVCNKHFEKRYYYFLNINLTSSLIMISPDL